MKCPICKGKGKYIISPNGNEVVATCYKCNGTGEVEMTEFEYLKNCTMDEMVQAIYDCTMANSWSFNKDGIKRWLKQTHHESVTNCNE